MIVDEPRPQSRQRVELVGHEAFEGVVCAFLADELCVLDIAREVELVGSAVAGRRCGFRLDRLVRPT